MLYLGRRHNLISKKRLLSDKFTLYYHYTTLIIYIGVWWKWLTFLFRFIVIEVLWCNLGGMVWAVMSLVSALWFLKIWNIFHRSIIFLCQRILLDIFKSINYVNFAIWALWYVRINNYLWVIQRFVYFLNWFSDPQINTILVEGMLARGNEHHFFLLILLQTYRTRYVGKFILWIKMLRAIFIINYFLILLGFKNVWRIKVSFIATF